jgi:hypothetical protein
MKHTFICQLINKGFKDKCLKEFYKQNVSIYFSIVFEILQIIAYLCLPIVVIYYYKPIAKSK